MPPNGYALWRIDQQAQVTHADAGGILNYGADAVDTGGRKLIGEDEKIIIQRTDHGDGRNAEIGKNLFQPLHFSPPWRWLYFLQYNILRLDFQGKTHISREKLI